MKGRKRRTHYVAVKTTVSECRDCGAAIRPHYACPNCGQYRGRAAIVASDS
jgi:large subunit ribosomal protein L32